MTIQQLEYKGLNLMDIVGTVELAIDAKMRTIHIFDTQQIVEPEYDFATKGYRLSEGFYKMAAVLKEKPLLLTSEEVVLNQWIEAYRWIFYCSKQTIKQYENGHMKFFTKEHFPMLEVEENYYPNYILRLK